MRFKRVLAALVAAFALAGASLTTAPNFAVAASTGCYGDWCSGQDSAVTGCANDGRTVASNDLYEQRGSFNGDIYWTYVGKVELRWSPKCKTNWARFTGVDSSGINTLKVVQDTGYTKSKSTVPLWGGWTKPGVYWSPMIYSPVHHCQATVDGGLTGRRGTDWV